MKGLDVAIAIVAILIIIVGYPRFQKCYLDNTEEMCIGNDCYLVKNEYVDRDMALKVLHELNNRVLELLRHLKHKYKINTLEGDIQMMNSPAREVINRILTNYNSEVISENVPVGGEDTSYTLDKGEKLFICLRDIKNGHHIHDIDNLFFVVLHEISHMGTLSWGHKIEFWTNFKLVLHEAHEAGLYEPVNYAFDKRPYCGILIEYNPLFDEGLESLWLKN